MLVTIVVWWCGSLLAYWIGRDGAGLSVQNHPLRSSVAECFMKSWDELADREIHASGC